jgi:hypothetical protein
MNWHATLGLAHETGLGIAWLDAGLLRAKMQYQVELAIAVDIFQAAAYRLCPTRSKLYLLLTL